MKKDLTKLIADYAAAVNGSEEVAALGKRLLPDGEGSRAKGAAAVREAIKAGKVLGEVEASTNDEAYQHFHEAMEFPALGEVLGELKVESGKGQLVPLPLHGEMLDMVGQALQSYLSPLLASAWKYAYMKGRAEEAAKRERVPF